MKQGGPSCEIVAPQESSTKKKYLFSSKSKIIFARTRVQGQNEGEGNKFSSKVCGVHGCCDIREHMIDLTSTKEKFISYICLLAQLYFKILNIEDGHEDMKEVRRKYLCNLLFSVLQNSQRNHYYYPLRALAEFYIEGESEKALSKRLTESNLLTYKYKKDFMGRTQLL